MPRTFDNAWKTLYREITTTKRDGIFFLYTLYPNSKHVFPEMKLLGLVPHFYIHVSVSDLYTESVRKVMRLGQLKKIYLT
jgi:hypothetical protein